MIGLIIAGVALVGGGAYLGLRKGKPATQADKEIEEKAKLYTPETLARKRGLSAEEVRKRLADQYPHSKAGTPLRVADNERTRKYRGPKGEDNPGAKIRMVLTDGETSANIYHYEIGEYLGVSTGKIYLDDNYGFLQIKDFDNETAYVAIDNVETDPRGVQADNRNWYDKAKDWATGWFSGLGDVPVMGKYAFVIGADGVLFGDETNDVVLTWDFGTACTGNYAANRGHAGLSTRNAANLPDYVANVTAYLDAWMRGQDWGFVQGNPETGLVELFFDLKNTRDFAGVDVCQTGITVCQHASNAAAPVLQITPLEPVCSSCPDPALSGPDAASVWIETTRRTPAFDATTQLMLRDKNGKIRSFPAGRIVGQSVERKSGLQVVRSVEDERLLVFPLESVRIVIPNRKSLSA